MNKFFLVFVLSCLLVPSVVQAQDSDSQEYVIQKNDTLWDISNSKLEDPFLWPKLWNVNPHISNPDRIFPGEKIIIPSRKQLTQQEAVPVDRKLTSITKTKTPEAKASETETRPHLKMQKEYLIDKDFYMSIGWISEDSSSIGKIIATPSGNEISGKNDIVYINILNENILPLLGLSDKNVLVVAPNEHSKNRFFAIRNIKAVKHPVTGKILGNLLRITGILEIVGMDNNTLKAKVIRSFEDVQIGDSLMPYKEMEPPLVHETVRAPKIDGYIVESLLTHEMSTKGNIVLLDKGLNDGLLAGDTFSVLSGSSIERVIGKIQIVSLQPATSAAVILNNVEEVSIGNKWGQK